MMKKSVTLRLDTEVLADARRCAVVENRTLTNFVETVLKQHIAIAAKTTATFVQPNSLSRPTMDRAPTERKA